jgi:large subunit ribosomal protein L21
MTRFDAQAGSPIKRSVLLQGFSSPRPCEGRGHGLGSAAHTPMAYAVIRTGGKQYRVAEGDTVQVELLAGNPGDKVKFDDVLMIGGDAPKFGAPLVAGAAVEGEIVQQGRGPKLIVFKFRKRKRSRRKAGHRQGFTAVKITGVTG